MGGSHNWVIPTRCLTWLPLVARVGNLVRLMNLILAGVRTAYQHVVPNGARSSRGQPVWVSPVLVWAPITTRVLITLR